jgi:alpha-methylacyl-CoA racemase
MRTKTRSEWCALMEGGDVCFAPVLTWGEAYAHPHNKARETFVTIDGITQPNVAPRFLGTPSAIQGPPAELGAHTREAMTDWGLPAGLIDRAAAS